MNDSAQADCLAILDRYSLPTILTMNTIIISSTTANIIITTVIVAMITAITIAIIILFLLLLPFLAKVITISIIAIRTALLL